EATTDEHSREVPGQARRSGRRADPDGAAAALDPRARARLSAGVVLRATRQVGPEAGLHSRRPAGPLVRPRLEELRRAARPARGADPRLHGSAEARLRDPLQPPRVSRRPGA